MITFSFDPKVDQLLYVANRLSPEQKAEATFNTRNDTVFRCFDRSLRKSFVGFTVLVDGEPAGVAGCVEQTPSVALPWGFFTDAIRQDIKAFVAYSYRFIAIWNASYEILSGGVGAWNRTSQCYLRHLGFDVTLPPYDGWHGLLPFTRRQDV